MSDDRAAPPGSAAALQQRFGPRYRWLVLMAVMIGTMASIMASTIINVAIPEISEVFAVGQERAQWLSAGFMAAITLSMLPTPWLLERYGYRRTYVSAVLLLMFGGLGGALSTSFDFLLAMRVAEGLAAGVMQPIPAIIVMRAFQPHEQGRAMGLFGFGVVLAPAVGPSAGGVLVDWFGWRSVFFVVVPLCLLSLVLARRYLPVSAPGGVRASDAGPRFDVLGLCLLALAVLSLLNGLVQLHEGGASAALLLAGSAVVTIAFIVQQKRRATPLLQLALFRHRSFAMGACVSFIYGVALYGSTYLVPVFMLIALHLPATQAGGVLLPAGLVLAATIPIAGRLADHAPLGRLVLIGMLLMALSSILMVLVDQGSGLLVISLWLAVGRVGLGFVLPSLNLASLRGLPAGLISQGASSISFVRQLGGAIGVSLVGIVLEWRLRAPGVDPVTAFHETFVMLGLITAGAAVAATQMRPPAQAGSAPS